MIHRKSRFRNSTISTRCVNERSDDTVLSQEAEDERLIALFDEVPREARSSRLFIGSERVTRCSSRKWRNILLVVWLRDKVMTTSQ